MSSRQGSLWFAGKPGAFLVYRVNRRPIENPNLFTPPIPPDVFEHFVRTLAPGHQVVTGRGNQRVWRIGGLHRDSAARTLVGKLGWEPRGEEVIDTWADDEKDWLSETASSNKGRAVPFGFDGDTRLLTVLCQPRTQARTVAAVFERVLRDNEDELSAPSTEWSVEPILDAADFLSWLESLDTVKLVSFTARLPNPEPRAAFRDVAERMERLRATTYTEVLRSERDEGLIGVKEDGRLRQGIAMAEHGFATLRGEGTREEGTSRYKQTDRVANEPVEEVPGDWDKVWDLVRELLKTRLPRFLSE